MQAMLGGAEVPEETLPPGLEGCGGHEAGRGSGRGGWGGPPPPSRVLDPASGFCPRPAPVHRAPACPRSPSVRKATCAHTAGRKTTQRSPCGTELRVPWRRATLRSASLPVWGLSSLWGPPRPFQRRADLGFRFFSLPWPGHKALRVSPSVSRVSLGFHLRSALPGLQEAAVRLRLRPQCSGCEFSRIFLLLLPSELTSIP